MGNIKIDTKFDRAKWGGSGALYLKSAIAGVDSASEDCRLAVCTACLRVEGWVLRDWAL